MPLFADIRTLVSFTSVPTRVNHCCARVESAAGAAEAEAEATAAAAAKSAANLVSINSWIAVILM